MAVWNGPGGERWSAAGQGRRSHGRERGAARTFGAFAVRAKKHAARARVARGSFEISTHRLSHAYLRLNKIGERCGAFARSRILRNSSRTTCGDGPQEHSGDGQPDWRL